MCRKFLISLFSTNDILHYRLNFSQRMSCQPTKESLRYFRKTTDDTSNRFSPMSKSGGFIKQTLHLHRVHQTSRQCRCCGYKSNFLLLRISHLGTLSFQYYNGSCTWRVFVHEILYLILLDSPEQRMVLFHQQKETLGLGMCFTQELFSS